MRVQKPFQKRNKAIVLLLLPAIALLWIVGWSFYWIGHQKDKKQAPEVARKKDHVILMPAMLEETEEITS